MNNFYVNIISAGNKFLVTAVLIFFGVGAAMANPTGEQVVSGQATFVRQDNALTVTNTPSAIINWQSFSINSNEAVRFVQQSSISSVLNRITGQSPSTILGALQSNGRVFLINPNGIIFGQGARIDVNGLVASTLNISNQDFLAKKYDFSAGSIAGAIQNQGVIRTPSGGQVYLIAPNIENTGIINSPKGDILLAAGHSVQLVDSLDPDLAVVVSAPADKAVNLGEIVAQSGDAGIYAGLILQKGIVNADSAVVGENGKIIFKATQKVSVAGDSVTSAKGNTGNGGEIQILGEQVELLDNSLIDASGQTGGGEVLIGGDYQGKNSDVLNAETTDVGQGVSIKADALEAGDGGKVVLWADGITTFKGSISAKGGAKAGNGGNAEVSGKKKLFYQGMADLRAPKGKTGNLLLDPTDYKIAAAGGDITGVALGALLDTANLTVQTSDSGTQWGDITVADSVTWDNSNTLTLKAHNDIDINDSIINNAGGSLILRADSDADGIGKVAFGGGHVTLTGGGTATLYYNPTWYTVPTDYTGYFSGVTPLAYKLVTNLNQLQNMNTNLAGAYALGKDLDASSTFGWNSGQGFVPIGFYYDTNTHDNNPQDMSSLIFNGDGHTISNLYINLPALQYIGMFGGKGTSLIMNVGLLNVNITGNYQVGGLIAHTGGIVADSYVTGTVTGSNIVVGGLCGLSAGTIINSYSTATVNGNGNSWVGGLVGANWGTDARVINSYSTGAVNGSGGLVGGNYNTVANPVIGGYWNTQTSGMGGSAGGTGKTTSEMTAQSTFLSWDFTNIWGIVDGLSYPYLIGRVNAASPSSMTPITPGTPGTPATPASSVPARPSTAMALKITTDSAVVDYVEGLEALTRAMFSTNPSGGLQLNLGSTFGGGSSLFDLSGLAPMAQEHLVQSIIDSYIAGEPVGSLGNTGGLNYASILANSNLPGIGGTSGGGPGGFGGSGVLGDSSGGVFPGAASTWDGIKNGTVNLHSLDDEALLTLLRTTDVYNDIRSDKSPLGVSTENAISGALSRTLADNSNPTDIVQLVKSGAIFGNTLTDAQLLRVIDNADAFDTLIRADKSNPNIVSLTNAVFAANDRRLADIDKPEDVVSMVVDGGMNVHSLTDAQLLRVGDDINAFDLMIRADKSNPNAVSLTNAVLAANDRRLADEQTPDELVKLVMDGGINAHSLTDEQLLNLKTDPSAMAILRELKFKDDNVDTLRHMVLAASDRADADTMSSTQILQAVRDGKLDPGNLSDSQLLSLNKDVSAQISILNDDSPNGAYLQQNIRAAENRETIMTPSGLLNSAETGALPLTDDQRQVLELERLATFDPGADYTPMVPTDDFSAGLTTSILQSTLTSTPDYSPMVPEDNLMGGSILPTEGSSGVTIGPLPSMDLAPVSITPQPVGAVPAGQFFGYSEPDSGFGAQMDNSISGTVDDLLSSEEGFLCIPFL